MGLPGHRRTSSHKRRRASHFALTAPAITKDKSNRTHRMHVAAPGATEYNGIKIHVKGLERKLRKMMQKTKSKTVAHDHDHAGHDHHDHAHDEKQGKMAKINAAPAPAVKGTKRSGTRSK